MNDEEKCPRSVTVLIVYQCMEKFVFYGLKCGLWMYLNQNLAFTETQSTGILHFLLMLYSLSSFFGVFIEGRIPNIWLCFLLNMVYVTAAIGLAVVSTIDSTKHEADWYLAPYIVLFVAAGAVKPCFIALSLGEFRSLRFSSKFSHYVTWNYILMNITALAVAVVAPTVRTFEKCSICSGLMYIIFCGTIFLASMLLILSFVCFKSTERKPKRILRIFACIRSARKNRTANDADWMDAADDKYDGQCVLRAKIFLSVIALFTPLPFFWALFEQTHSTWVQQAKHMQRLYFNVDFQPDHTQAIYPAISLLCIAFNEFIFYNILQAIDFSKPLHRVITGMFVAVVAFVAAFLIQTNLEQHGPRMPHGSEAHFRVINGLKCDYQVNFNVVEHSGQFILSHMSMREVLDVKLENDWSWIYFNFNPAHTPDAHHCAEYAKAFMLQRGKSKGFFIEFDQNNKSVTMDSYDDDVDRSFDLKPKIRTLVDATQEVLVTLKHEEDDDTHMVEAENFGEQFTVREGKYTLKVDNKTSEEFHLKRGGVYVILVLEDNNDHETEVLTITPPLELSIWKIIPQFALMTFAESLVTSNWLYFLFEEAPQALKPILEALFYLTIFFGNLIVIIINLIDALTLKWKFLVHIILMSLSFILMSFLVRSYKQVNVQDRISSYLPPTTDKNRHTNATSSSPSG